MTIFLQRSMPIDLEQVMQMRKLQFDHVHGTRKKKPLTRKNSPFLVYFDYGENRDGYWKYNHMVCQFEDTNDLLKVMHPNYKFSSSI